MSLVVFPRERRLVGPWAVYGLVDPRDGLVFYIGCTVDPINRLSGHFTDPSSAAYFRMRELRGYKPKIRIYGWYEDKEAALDREADLTLNIPNLVNRRLGRSWSVASEWHRAHGKYGK